MSENFLCPIPWTSLSFGPNSTPRVCCHQTGVLKNISKDLKELKTLSHNKKVQQEMLSGIIPSECSDCAQLEKNGCESPRLQYLEKFPLKDISQGKIEYLDITIDNRCNLECIMCSPNYSQRLNTFFTKNLKQRPVEKWELQFSNEEMKELLSDLKMLTLTGGEPLLSHKAMSFLAYVANDSNASHIDLRLFTNLSSIPHDFEKILNCFQSVELILSIDSIQENYEFIRYPAKWDLVNKNIQTILSLNLPNTILNFHAVIMACNWSNLVDLIEYYQSHKINPHSLLPIFVEIENPVYLHPTVLPPDEFSSGLIKINQWISKQIPNNDFERSQLKNFQKLIQKIEDKNFQNHFIEYKAYMMQLNGHRNNHNVSKW